MASSHKTEHYGLSQFAPLDRPAWLVDYNTDMEKIDTALHNLDETGGGSGTLDQTARDMAQAAQDAAKDAQEMATAAQATADEALEKAEEALNQQGTITGDITNINEEITQIKVDVNTAQSTATTANETAEEALELAQGCVKRSGDTMTGPLKLVGNPVADADAANKGYVDSVAGNPFPDVPFTDDRWKLAVEVGTDPVNFTFPRLPREFLIVGQDISVNDILLLESAAGDRNITLEIATLSNAPVTNFSVLKQVVIINYNNSIYFLNLASTDANTPLIYLGDDLSTTFRITSGLTSGKIKIYWR